MNQEDNICEHNNTITNECSDCNEQELIDAHHRRVLRASLTEIYNICCDSLDDIVSHHCEGYKEFIYIGLVLIMVLIILKKIGKIVL